MIVRWDETEIRTYLVAIYRKNDKADLSDNEYRAMRERRAGGERKAKERRDDKA